MKARQVLRELFGESAVDVTSIEELWPGVTKCIGGHLNGYPNVFLELETLEGEYDDFRLKIYIGNDQVYNLFAGDLESDDGPIPRVRLECLEEEGTDICQPHTPEGMAVAQLILRFCEISQGTVPTE